MQEMNAVMTQIESILAGYFLPSSRDLSHDKIRFPGT